MNFSIRATTCRLFAPQHKVSCSWLLWQALCHRLRLRGRQRTRESGAFLLGYERENRKRIVDFILYDDLDPHSLDTGIVHFNGRYFGDLWKLCEARGLSVVADIHVHPGSAQQSVSDRAHPMISQAGHVAMILPDFAKPPMRRRNIGIYEYIGRKQWRTIAPEDRAQYFHIGL